ncbi:putative uncharacterized protein [Prevotella sp. CAG:1058]|nr:putative uncharacterized protein [Prevotella sp. CAG:1058]
MDENNNIIENGIRLQDCRIIQGYPKQDPVVEEDKETPVLDTTGEYFSIRKKPQKPKLTDEEESVLRNLFTDNAFLILANRERILNDSRMLLTSLHVRNGLAYSGAFQTTTLGVYIEWWINAPYSVLFDEKDDAMSLIWYVSGSPLSGGNLCANVTEEGETETVRVPFFRKLWPKFADIIADYHEPKKLYQAYTLPEVIDILKRETTEEFYKESIRQFHYEAKIRLLNAELDGWKDRWKRTQETCDDYQHKWHIALINSRLDKVKSFYEDYMQRKEALHIRKEELTEDNHNLKARLRKGELTNKEYQPLLTKNKKEVENMDFDMHCFRKDRLPALFPEMAEHFNGRDEIKYTEERILDEIIELFSKDNADN